MISDFGWLIDTYGHVPNGTRTYYLGRSQPPFFFEMVALLRPQDPAAGLGAAICRSCGVNMPFGWPARTLAGPGASRRVVRLPDGSVLNRYWDDFDLPRDESWREDVELARSSGGSPDSCIGISGGGGERLGFQFRWLHDPRWPPSKPPRSYRWT